MTEFVEQRCWIKFCKTLGDFQSTIICNQVTKFINVASHSLQLIQTFLMKHEISIDRQLSYSHHIVPGDFWIFIKLKLSLFESTGEIYRTRRRDGVEHLLKIIPRNLSDS